MRLLFRPILLELCHPFRLATGSRTHTNAMLTEIHFEGFVGYGEAAMPPYYGENHETAGAFLKRVASVLDKFPESLSQGLGTGSSIQIIISELDALAPGNHAAKASVDIALHDLWGKMEGRPLWQLLSIEPDKMPPTSFTLGIDEPAMLRQKMLEAADFQIIKIKLGSEDDRQIIRTIRENSDKPIYADANQGWKNREEALDLVQWLAEQNVLLIEQPFQKDDLDSAAWLTARSPLPIIADESFQRLADLDHMANCFHGVNIKLMKCTGISEGFRAAHAAKAKGLQLMVGCMTETSCGILAAALLAPLCDFADIDGCWLIRNNPFEMPVLENGKLRLSEEPGLGLKSTSVASGK
ncbi:MAG: dipeptide epimerase [Saprospiraceae bacterium]|nr:dipeptide epimerase [Saprospiraceae bacterium]